MKLRILILILQYNPQYPDSTAGNAFYTVLQTISMYFPVLQGKVKVEDKMICVEKLRGSQVESY